jgi:3,4-dihydroxy 2-butanone 4-phosphate synthase/GTP cyclohydrolase II
VAKAELARLKHGFLSAPEELIEEARNGRMVILVDDEDRENEGDLVIPAQMATPDAVNFMARFGRGLICLALTAERARQLDLEPMTRVNRTPLGTAFTASIEAREGISTGISAADRARTVAVAIDASNGPDAIVSPGHVFPLIAKDGGVLVRTGHTEAAVDLARLAGLNPSGVICEIMKDDGTMARLDDLVAFAQFHNLKLGTIRDLIAYRRRYDHLVEKRAEAKFQSDWGGDWTALTFWNKADGSEQVALVKGKVSPDKPTLVRMHALSPFTDMFGEGGKRGGLLRRSMEIIAEEGAGVVVVINRSRPDAFTMALQARAGALEPKDMEELRDYGVGATILTELGVRDMILLTNTHHTLVGLDGYGLSIVGERAITESDG